MYCLFPGAFAVLAVAASAAAEFTSQTFPQSGDILQANQALHVQWQFKPGNSPDSDTVKMPKTVSVYLGYTDGGQPKTLFPPIGNDVDVSVSAFTWQEMNFHSFATPAPPRNMNTKWFIQLKDQNTGYISNGQLFTILENASGNVDGGNSLASASPISEKSGADSRCTANALVLTVGIVIAAKTS